VQILTKLLNLRRFSGANVYTRWGRTSCPSDGTDTVYTGVIGGGHYTHSGSASHYLCLSNDPEWDENEITADSAGYIYGTEYETNSSLSCKHLQNKEAPCTVCKADPRTVILIPARTTCYRGWKMKYAGYVMVEYYSHSGNKDVLMLHQRSFLAAVMGMKMEHCCTL